MLRIPQVYEIPVFGDYVLYAIAKGCKKNILVFNTSVHASDPIYVIRGTEYGGSIDSDIPVVIAYNQAHYESLHPKSLEDIEKTKHLVNVYSEGNYEYSKKDIPYLISFRNDVNDGGEISAELEKDSQDKKFTSSNKRRYIDVRGMSIEERRKYNREQYRKRKDELNSGEVLTSAIDQTKSNLTMCQSSKNRKQLNVRGMPLDQYKKDKKKDDYVQTLVTDDNHNDPVTNDSCLEKNIESGIGSSNSKRRRLKVREMSIEERREYKRNCYRKNKEKLHSKETQECKQNEECEKSLDPGECDRVERKNAISTKLKKMMLRVF